MLRLVSLLLGLQCLTVASGAELSGQITDANGAPIENAIVAISTAKPRVGPATTCPSCYVDCRRRSLTDDNGRFRIEGLSSKLLFRLAIGGSGYQGLLTDPFDPLEEPSIELQLEMLPALPGITRAWGTVVDLDGKPIPRAEVRSQVVQRGNTFSSAADPTVTPLTLTDDEGRFEFTAGKGIDSIEFRVVAPGFAPAQLFWSPAEDDVPKAELGRGASFRGRLMLDGKPLPHVVLGLIQKNRFVPNLVTPAEVSTDSEGSFRFDNLPPDRDYALYTHTGQNAKGVLPVSVVLAPAHGEQADLGDIATQSPARLSVTVSTEDGSPFPEKSRVYVGRRDAWCGSNFNLSSQSSEEVTIDDASRELFQVSVWIPGYDVIRTQPFLNADFNGAYVVDVGDNTSVGFVVRKQGAEAPKPGKL